VDSSQDRAKPKTIKLEFVASPLNIKQEEERVKTSFARKQDHLFEWSDMSIRRLLFQWASTIKFQLSLLV